jgi:trimethylamine--corrinoid protein Co-methyltransferase
MDKMICPERVSFRLLADDQIQQIHQATLTVLEKTGVIIDHPRALEILSGAGCKVSNKNRVYFPPHIVEEAIKRAPESVTIYSREGQLKMTLEDRRVYYGTVTSLPSIANIDGERRDYTLKDCKEMTIIMDSLDTLEFATGTGCCRDVPAAVSDVHEISCMLENSPKPVLITTHDEKGLKAIIDICSIYKGDMNVFASQPFIIYCVCPVSPLKYPRSSLGKLMMAVENGFPFLSVPAPMAGGTAPVSLAGTLVCGNAEILSSLVLTQAIRPGTPFLYGGFFTVMDMSSMIMTHGSPEFNLLNVAQAELAQHYHLPSFSSAGCTDSQEIDEQAAFECGFSTLATALGGANMVHAISVLGSGMAVSKELLVLCDELINYIRRFLQGIEVTEQSLATKEIDRIGPGGNFLQSDLTLTLFRKEHWFPKCFVRSQFDNWVKEGRKSLKERLAQKCKDILLNHIPSLAEEDKLREIKKVIECSDKERL